MKLNKQKSLIARALGIGKKRVKINPEKTEDLKEAITRADLKSVVGTAIKVSSKKGSSTSRIKVAKQQKRKGRRKGEGSKKGAKYSRISRKELWINKVRVQRKFLSMLKEKKKITSQDYRKLYRMISGGFFRSKAHLKLYITTKMESK